VEKGLKSCYNLRYSSIAQSVERRTVNTIETGTVIKFIQKAVCNQQVTSGFLFALSITRQLHESISARSTLLFLIKFFEVFELLIFFSFINLSFGLI